jgi:hypothetical protein
MEIGSTHKQKCAKELRSELKMEFFLKGFDHLLLLLLGS